MPTVPQAAPTVQSRPIDPGFQNASAATLDVFGGQNAAGLDQTGRRIAAAGDELHRLALKSMMEDNEREAKKLDVELSSALRSINYGDGTAQNPGYFGLKGEAALQGYEGAQKAVREAQKKLLDGAKNDRVKEMFGEVSARRLETELNTMARFVGQERVRAADTVSEARLSEAANDAARAWNNPQIIQRSVALAVNEVKDMAQRNGWGPEVEAAKTREAISVIATGAAKAALAVEATGAAQRIFKQYEGSFSPEARASISKQIRDGSVQHAAQALRDQAIAAYPGDLEKQAEFIRQKASGKVEDAALSSISTWHSIQRASQADRERAENKALRGESQAAFDRIQQAHPGDYQAQLEAAKKLSPELRDMVDQRIRSDHSIQNQLDEDVERAKRRAIQETELADRQRQRQEREDRKAANEQALAAVLAGTPISKLPPEVLNRLDRNDYVGLEKIERDVAAGHPAVTDWDYYGKVMQFSATQMADLNMTEAASKLGPKEFAQVRDMHAKALRGELDPSVGTPNQMVQAKIRELGLTGDEAKRKRAGQLQSLFLEQMNAEAKATGKKVPHERATEILNNLVDTVTVPAWFGMSTAEKRAYTVLHEIKQPDRERIAARLRAAGLTPTAKNIIDYYQREQQRAR